MDNYKKIMKKGLLAFTLFFGLLFTAATALLWYLELPLYYGVAVSIAIVLIQYLLSPVVVHMLFDINYEASDNLIRPELYKFLKETCTKINIPVPELGIIDDGTPNAFTFGYTSHHAKLIVTKGLLEILDEEEAKAVLSHELGHIKHNDFIAMMIVSLIPMILYQVYLWTRRSDKGKPIYWVGLTAYAVYILSQYMVLVFSRMREYYADHFSKQIMGNSEALKSALIKIAYGYTALAEKTTLPAASLGIANSAHSEGFVLTYGDGADIAGKIDRLVKWDLNNIWSKWYEIHSTHPLTAKRILALDDKVIISSRTGLKEIGKFLLEAVLSILPWLLVIGTTWMNFNHFSHKSITSNVIQQFINRPYLIVLLGLTILIKYYYSYRSGFESYRIEELLQLENASPVAGIPAILEGKIIGKGIPGLFYSEDLVIDDGSSIMLIDYRQPVKILEFLFGVFMAEEMKEKEVKVVGWYKRGIRPYFCCKYIIDGKRKIRSYSYFTNQAGAYMLLIAGLILWIL